MKFLNVSQTKQRPSAVSYDKLRSSWLRLASVDMASETS